MSNNLNHCDWVAEQFKPTYLKSSYRNAVLHASIIEAMLTAESKLNKFDSANKSLLCSKRINLLEFCAFNEVRKIRNELVHRIFVKEGLSQNEINALISELMGKVHSAYKISGFLDEKLFKKYKLPRSPDITFNSEP